MISAVLGMQFGDEGKGKITDFLSDRFQVAVRFNGGGNAGHTVVVKDKTYKFHLVPSGSLRCETVILGNGMVIDPHALNQEIDNLRGSQCKASIRISKMAHVVTPMHKILDRKEEEIRSKLSIGTTAQGIGPTYEDKYARTGIRMVDLLSTEILREKIDTIFRMKEGLLKDTEFSSPSARETMVLDLFRSGKLLEPYMEYTEVTVRQLYDEGKSILFEGAQGTMLDIDFGMYPFVTSSNALAGALSLGAGFPFRKVDYVIGVVKAYMSKVGAGPFPTEIQGDDAHNLRELGHEYGTTTGRPRRVGWLDIPLLRYAIKMNDADALAITRLDTLGEMDKIRVCLSYKKDGQEIDYIPRTFREMDDLELKYTDIKPWGKISESVVKEHNFAALPGPMKDYIKLIEDQLKVPVDVISLGQGRENTLVRDGSRLRDQEPFLVGSDQSL
ncbi:MAG: adenylosuccinate synthase [Candidatus Thermoplasmatota archaeon]|nr:adenylosuccinate synthase [Candidatus Thermoplasmatota archaeon]